MELIKNYLDDIIYIIDNFLTEEEHIKLFTFCQDPNNWITMDIKSEYRNKTWDNNIKFLEKDFDQIYKNIFDTQGNINYKIDLLLIIILVLFKKMLDSDFENFAEKKNPKTKKNKDKKQSISTNFLFTNKGNIYLYPIQVSEKKF